MNCNTNATPGLVALLALFASTFFSVVNASGAETVPGINRPCDPAHQINHAPNVKTLVGYGLYHPGVRPPGNLARETFDVELWYFDYSGNHIETKKETFTPSSRNRRAFGVSPVKGAKWVRWQIKTKEHHLGRCDRQTMEPRAGSRHRVYDICTDRLTALWIDIHFLNNDGSMPKWKPSTFRKVCPKRSGVGQAGWPERPHIWF